MIDVKVQADDVYELFYEKLKSVCTINLGWNEFSSEAFNSIKVEDQLPGEDICATIARHMVEALTHGIIDK